MTAPLPWTALYPTLHVQQIGDQILLWHRQTGRYVWLHPESWEWHQRLPVLLNRLNRLSLLTSVEAAGWFPIRSTLTFLLPDRPALWAPVAHQLGAGGYPYCAIPLNAKQAALWQACDGQRSLASLCESLNIELKDALRWCQQWVQIDHQSLQFRPQPVQRPDPSLRRLLSPPRPDNARHPDQVDADGGTTLTHYHLHDILDAGSHFDDRETTVAHALALPHPGLQGRRFGQRLCERLTRLHANPRVILEVGGGTGELASALRDALNGEPLYLRADLSPALLLGQAQKNPGSPGVLADATRLPFASNTIDWLVNNEMIADLPAVPIGASGQGRTVQRFIKRYGLNRLDEAARYNLGAWRFVEEIARLLAPGGVAYLSEFGGPDETPTETEQLDHPEVSIHFGHLVAIAKQNGLKATLLPLDVFLDVDLAAPQLCRASYSALRALAHERSESLQARAWTSENVPIGERVIGLCNTTLADEGPGPLITRFWALLLERPHR